MRYRKRVKIAKGLYINLSGSGASLSIGTKGASVTIGKKGTYLNTGIPGTGIYNRKKIGGSTKTKNPNYLGSNSTSVQSKMDIELTLDEKGNPLLKITDSYGQEITDEKIIRKVKGEEQYKKGIEKLINDKRTKVDDTLKSFIEIYKSTPKLIHESDIREELNNICPEKYEKKQFTEPKPSIEKVKLDLENEAKQKINKLLFWKNRKLIDEFVTNNTHQRLQELMDRWSRKRDQFDAEQGKVELEKNNVFLNQYNETKNELESYLNGNEDFVCNCIEALLSEITLPVDFSIDYDYNKDKSTLYIDLDLPEIEDMPKEKVNTLASGKISIKEKTQKEIKQEYCLCVCGIAFYFSGLLFNISSKINIIQISGYTQRVNKKTGNIEDEYVYSIKFSRLLFEKINIEKIDPIEALSNFENRINMTSTFDLKTVEPFEAK
jgi:hypothetical protein